MCDHLRESHMKTYLIMKSQTSRRARLRAERGGGPRVECPFAWRPSLPGPGTGTPGPGHSRTFASPVPRSEFRSSFLGSHPPRLARFGVTSTRSQAWLPPLVRRPDPTASSRLPCAITRLSHISRFCVCRRGVEGEPAARRREPPRRTQRLSRSRVCSTPDGSERASNTKIAV